MLEKETVLEDWSIVAYGALPHIQKKYHLEITPFKKSDGRVAFRIRGDIESYINDLYANKVIIEYMQSMRNVRRTIFTLRALNG